MPTLVQRQYQELKDQNPEALLFFQLGDFYELFYEDAILCSRVLGIALTARHRGTENEMPMCGFPCHSHQEHLEKLIQSGYKVALADQVEDPETKKIHREVTRVVTPGTSQESGTLQEEKNSFLMAIEKDKKQFALAYTDFTTGEFRTSIFDHKINFLDEVFKIYPQEILLPQEVLEDKEFCDLLPPVHITPYRSFSSSKAITILKDHFKTENLDLFNLGTLDLLIRSSALILQYLKETQKTDVSHINTLKRYTPQDIMQMDRHTYRHLEIFEPIYAEEKTATLWSVFEKSLTALGARTLRHWLCEPLTDETAIHQRLEALEALRSAGDFQNDLRRYLSKISDIERIVARISTGKATPREVSFLKDSMGCFSPLEKICKSRPEGIFKNAAQNLKGFEELYQKLEVSLVEHPPLEMTSGGIFRKGIDKGLDELRELTEDSQKWLRDFTEKNKKETGISNLKIKYAKNFGFCFEVSPSHISKVPPHWMRRQTLVTAERYTTPELAEYEEKVLSSEGEMYQREHQMFLRLREEILTFTAELQKAAHTVGFLDSLMTLFRTAEKYRWTKPHIKSDQTSLLIIEGRHPVVEKLRTEVFVSNDLAMGRDKRFHLITGPNMSGKSTFLRQNALIVFLAHIGSFVPAQKASLGIFDRIFTRVGASDNLAGGKSTFFVEMSETARILHGATEKSFIILDEIGRGTSTFDGISLAWAISEFLHDHIKAKTLFATHYHELIDLVDSFSAGENFHVNARQKEDGILFLHKISPGGISDSFGIEVAQKAGIPRVVIQNAKKILSRLESDNTLKKQPTLFSFSPPQERVKEVIKPSPVEKILEECDLDQLSPKKALDILYKMREIIKENEKDF